MEVNELIISSIIFWLWCMDVKSLGVKGVKIISSQGTQLVVLGEEGS